MAVWEGAVSRGKDAHCVQGTNGTEQTRSTVGTNCGWESCPFSHFLGTRRFISHLPQLSKDEERYYKKDTIKYYVS